jgi:poly(A) polymerase
LLKRIPDELNETSQPAEPGSVARIIARADHNISRSQIATNALRVLYRLKDAGFQAFLVGGCVRDIMIGRRPKDFDVATNALPEEVRTLFRNSRLVGRRFRLAHVVFGREIIEVATFRAANAPSPGDEPVTEDDAEAEAEVVENEGMARFDEPESAPESNYASTDRVQDTHGRLLRDNAYGSLEEDVWRRDFTVNALYYNIADFSLWDFTGGTDDVAARRLRLIGDPQTRYREDPVRMLRAARFEAKLGFTLDQSTAQPIPELRQLLSQVPPPRLFDETLKLFLMGHGERSLQVLRERGLLQALLPSVDSYLKANPGNLVEQLLVQGLRNTDSRVVSEKPVTPTFLFALLLYGPIARQIESLPPQRWHELRAIVEACDRCVREASRQVTIPRRVSLGLREMYALQPRLEQPRGRRALRLLEQPRFRAGYDLLILRAQFGLASADMAAWWTRLQELRPEDREQALDSMPGTAQPPRAAESDSAAGDGAAPRGRRRRRRRRAPPGPV